MCHMYVKSSQTWRNTKTMNDNLKTSFSRRARALLVATTLTVRFWPVFAHFCPILPPVCIIGALLRLAALKPARHSIVLPFW